MDWKELKNVLTKGAFELTISGNFGQSKTLTLTMDNKAKTFTSLGTGSMKRVLRVDEENWVLALAGDDPMAVKDIEGEVSTLKKIGLFGIRVPEPFDDGTAGTDEIIFKLTVYNDDSGEEKEYPAFLQGFFPKPPYKEMPKLNAKGDFAKNHILQPGGRVPSHIQKTVDDLNKIRDYFKKKGEWGDFQVMYNSLNGKVYVFDPLPQNLSGEKFIELVDKWLKDIQDARDAEQKKRAPQPGFQGSRPRSRTI